ARAHADHRSRSMQAVRLAHAPTAPPAGRRCGVGPSPPERLPMRPPACVDPHHLIRRLHCQPTIAHTVAESIRWSRPAPHGACAAWDAPPRNVGPHPRLDVDRPRHPAPRRAHDTVDVVDTEPTRPTHSSRGRDNHTRAAVTPPLRSVRDPREEGMSVMTGTVEHRAGFHSLRRGGLDWNTLPLRLFAKGNRKFWDPADIDFSVDARDWEKLTDRQRLSATYLCAQFAAGEEAVTEDIQPFLRAMAAEGRLGDEMYLAQFCFEEAKHTEAFRRWMDAVGLTDDLHPFVAENPHYRKLFYEELPESLGVLAEGPSPRNLVRASVTYNHVIEGSLALTGYYAWQKLCVRRGILPG